ncbi:MAG: sulfotransferase [Phycisphaerales bacterium]|nr:sulfotransferase [Phycisphaerales bacterium]
MNTPEIKQTFNSIEEKFRYAEQLEHVGRFNDALLLYQQITKAQPRWPFGYFGVGSAYYGIGKFENARRSIRKAIELKENHSAFHGKIADVYNRLDDIDNALKSADRAIELEPTNSFYLVTKASILRYNGENQLAFNLLDDAIQNGDRSDLLVRIYASLCGSLDRPNDGILVLEPLTQTVHSDPMITATHLFVLSKLFDQAGDYARAYECARHASELRGDVYNIEDRENLINERISVWTKERFQSMPKSRVSSDKPVFIVGMPRSGTTLIEQIIAAHPLAYGCGELIGVIAAANEIASETKSQTLQSTIESLKPASLDRVARRLLKEMEKQAPKGEKPIRITDKMPLNFQHIGLIEILFPNAKIIHCQRHVLDNFISCYLLDFAGLNNQAYTYDPVNFAHFYSLYLKYMDHWKSVCSIPILDVSYEDTIADQRAMTERILEFLQLEWDDQCMSFFETKRAVNTASVEQVRKKIYTSSKARWKNYESHLAPVQEALAKFGVEY